MLTYHVVCGLLCTFALVILLLYTKSQRNLVKAQKTIELLYNHVQHLNAETVLFSDCLNSILDKATSSEKSSKNSVLH